MAELRKLMGYYIKRIVDYSRGVFGGGSTGSDSSVIDDVNINILSNARSFGNLTSLKRGLGACSSQTRGLFAGGYKDTGGVVRYDAIDYVTISTPSNATDFGDLTVARTPASCSNSTRGLIGGGYSTANSNVIDYVTIATTGNATDFGDLTVARSLSAACSDSHGGL